MRTTIPLFRNVLSRSLLLPALSSSSATPTVSPRPFHRTVPPPPFSNLRYAQDFCALIKVLSRNPRDPRLLTALNSLLTQTHLLDSTTSVLVLRGLSLTKKLNRAKSLLAALKTNGTIPDLFIYSLVLQCLLPVSPIRDVESVWAEITGPSVPSTDASHFVVHLCQHSNNPSEIEAVYRRASSSNWGLTRQAYTSLISAMCGRNNPNPGLARAVLREMEERGFEADGLTYLALFQSFCRVGEPSEADSVLRNMVDRKNYELDANIYGNFLHGLCKSGKFREARKLFDKLTKRDRLVAAAETAPMLKHGRRIIFQLIPPAEISAMMAFTAYFQSLCNAEKVDEAERLLEAMRKSIVPEICVYRSFVEVLFRVGRADDAIKFFEDQRMKGYVSVGDIEVAAVAGLCEMGRVDDGYRLLCEMVDGGFVPTSRVWNYILQSYWEGGRVEDAMALFNRMRAENIGGGGRPDASTYSVMIHGLLGKADIGMAISLMNEAIRKNIQFDAALHSAVSRGLGEHRGLEEALRYLNQLIENGTLVSYTAWELLVDSLVMVSRDDILLNIVSPLSLEDTNENSSRSRRNSRPKQ